MTHGARIAVSSVTYAIQAREILAKYGITATIVRLHPTETPSGCAFGLQIPPRNLSEAVSLLTKAEIKFTKIQR